MGKMGFRRSCNALGLVAVIASLLALGGCATWVKPGATEAQRDAQTARCQAGSFQRAPAAPVTVMTNPGGWVPPEKECWKEHGERRCRIRDGYYQGPSYSTEDVNEGARDALFDECMYNAGWVKKYPGS